MAITIWDGARLHTMIREREQESLYLDYKRSDALENTDKEKHELSKDVSAFANADGGVLVYGLDEYGHYPKTIDGGCDPNAITMEWLEQVIRIAPAVAHPVPSPRYPRRVLRGGDGLAGDALTLLAHSR